MSKKSNKTYHSLATAKNGKRDHRRKRKATERTGSYDFDMPKNTRAVTRRLGKESGNQPFIDKRNRSAKAGV